MAATIESPETRDDLVELLDLHDRVYESRAAAHLEFQPLMLPVLTGESPFAAGRTLRPFLAREHGEAVARVVAAVDGRYLDWWNDGVGHLLLYEATPDARTATRRLLDAACAWLRDRGMRFARIGMGMLELPFVIDDYETLPPLGVRQNPSYYHAFLKDASFETERGMVDYKIEVTPARLSAYESAVAAARRDGFDLVPLREIPDRNRIGTFTSVYNETFRRHWGFSPFGEADLSLLLDLQEPLGASALSLVAYHGREPAGVVWVASDASGFARRKPGRVLRADERVNFLGIGVREPFRGRGVNLAMAAHAYLELVAQGATWVSYTMVLDDNWPSRRTAEKLGARACASYVTYLRRL